MKAVLKLLLGSGSMAGLVALVLTVQSVATSSPLVVMLQRNVPHPSESPPAPQTHIFGVSVDTVHGRALIRFTPFTPQATASAFGAQYGMTVSYTHLTLPTICSV